MIKTSEAGMRANLSRMVWVILIAFCAVFCVLAIGIPLAVRSYLFNANIAAPTVVEAISGTVLVQGLQDREPIGVGMVDPTRQGEPRTRTLMPGATVTTDSTARAFLTFQRGRPHSSAEEEIVLTTAQLYSDARLQIVESRSPRFAASPRPDRIVLQIDAGQVRIAPGSYGEIVPSVEVRTPHCSASLRVGSYSFRVTEEQTEVIVRFGEATVEAKDRGVVAVSGQRVVTLAGTSPQLPVPAAQNLIANGNFVSPLSPSWQVDRFQATDDAVAGKAEIVTEGGRKAVFLSRMGSDGVHTEVGISQVINRNVLDFESLTVRLDVKLLYQSLSGGGYLSSEFPLMIRIDYKDIYGIDRFWIRGFYYQNVDEYPIQPDTWGQPIGEQIPHALWYPYESDNLLAVLGDIRPAHIHSIRLYASGWSYQTMAAEVGLVGQ